MRITFPQSVVVPSVVYRSVVLLAMVVGAWVPLLHPFAIVEILLFWQQQLKKMLEIYFGESYVQGHIFIQLCFMKTYTCYVKAVVSFHFMLLFKTD